MARFAWVLNGIGLILSFIGSLLLLFGGPKASIGLGNFFVGGEEELRKMEDPGPDVKEQLRKLDRNREMLKWGLWLIAIGFFLQAAGWLFSYPAANSSVVQNVYK